MNGQLISPLTQDIDISNLLQLDQYDTSSLNQPGLPNFGDLTQRAVRGELDLSLTGLIQSGIDIIFGELLLNAQLIRQLLIVAILGALIRCLTEAFTHKSAGELGFYVTYLMMVLLAISSFQLSVGILTGLVSLVSTMMMAATPIMISLMAMSGNIMGAAGFHPLMFFAFQLVTWFISSIFIPLILAAAALDIVNQISEENKLEKMAEVVRKIAAWTLKSIIALFAFLLTLQKISTPIVNNLAVRTTRTAVGAIPMVGNALNAAVDTVVYFGQAARSGVLVALVLVICVALAAPLIKMLVLSWIYRVTAGFIQPVADKRLVKCMDSIGKHMGQLFSAAALVGVMSIYSVIILLSI